MKRNILFALAVGVVGVAILLALGLWQLQRLSWKEGILAEMAARQAEAPMVGLPEAPDERVHAFRAVRLEGEITGAAHYLIASVAGDGPGHRLLVPFTTTAGQSLILDLGYLAGHAEVEAPIGERLLLTGRLFWPDEIDPGYTPEPDLQKRLWFARDLEVLGAALGTEPYMVVAEEITSDSPRAIAQLSALKQIPVGSNIPNDHLEYAITWFSLAVVWAAMTGYLITRIRRRTF